MQAKYATEECSISTRDCHICCRSPDKGNSCVNIASDVNDVIDVNDGNDVDDGNDGNDDAKNDGGDPPSSTLPPVSKRYFFVVLFSFHILLSS